MSAGILELDREEIDAFLHEQVVGRIGCHADGVTYVVPVIYAYDGNCLYAHTLVGQKVAMMRSNAEVCFEVDEYLDGSWRSVIVQGRYEELEEPLHSASSTYPWPHVIRLVHYVRVPRGVKRKISRRALFARDGWRCVYCGTASGRLTLDHVVPRSRGGDSVWENVVTSCAPCNHKKGNRLPTEAQMILRVLPRAPAPVLFIQLAAPRIPSGWRPYLGAFGASTA